MQTTKVFLILNNNFSLLKGTLSLLQKNWNIILKASRSAISIVYFPSSPWSYYMLKINGDSTAGSQLTRKSMNCLLGKMEGKIQYVMKGKNNRCSMRGALWLKRCWQGMKHIWHTLHVIPFLYRVLCIRGLNIMQIWNKEIQISRIRKWCRIITHCKEKRIAGRSKVQSRYSSMSEIPYGFLFVHTVNMAQISESAKQLGHDLAFMIACDH